MKRIHHRLIVGLAGTRLSDEERRWLHHFPPLGIILFARNIETPAQVAALLDDARQCAGQPLWAAIDEEGGRVTRLSWAPFSDRRPAAKYGAMYGDAPALARQAVYEDARNVGEALQRLGFTHNCAPVLDVFHPSADAIIGTRAYGPDVCVIAALGAACIKGLQAAGVAAVGKHFPGHGRADADSHLAVPHVDASMAALLREAEVFRVCMAQGLKHIMTAHVVYEKVDSCVATLSGFWLRKVLRGRFGFTGRIWSDDLCMKGVGDHIHHAATQAVEAGCDVLLVCDPAGVREIYEAMC